MTELLNLMEYYKSLEHSIMEKLGKLPRYNAEHDCDQPIFFKVVRANEIHGYCLTCGGKA